MRLFISWDSEIYQAPSALDGLRERGEGRQLVPDQRVDITVLGPDPNQGYVPTLVGDALERCEGVLALVDLPDGGVGREIGWRDGAWNGSSTSALARSPQPGDRQAAGHR